MGLRLQQWCYFGVHCDRCLATAREEHPLPIELCIKPGDIAAAEWAYDSGWDERHGHNHCPRCLQKCRAGHCPPQHPFNIKEELTSQQWDKAFEIWNAYEHQQGRG